MKRFNIPSLRIAALAVGLALATTGCDKQLEFEPGDVILAEDAINTADDLQRMLNSNYDVLANLLNGRQQSIAELAHQQHGTPLLQPRLYSGLESGDQLLHPHHGRPVHGLLLRHLPRQRRGGQL